MKWNSWLFALDSSYTYSQPFVDASRMEFMRARQYAKRLTLLKVAHAHDTRCLVTRVRFRIVFVAGQLIDLWPCQSTRLGLAQALRQIQQRLIVFGFVGVIRADVMLSELCYWEHGTAYRQTRRKKPKSRHIRRSRGKTSQKAFNPIDKYSQEIQQNAGINDSCLDWHIVRWMHAILVHRRRMVVVVVVVRVCVVCGGWCPNILE